MKTKTYRYLVVILSLVMIFAASCGREEGAGAIENTTTRAPADLEETVPSSSQYGASLTLHGVVCRAGETLLVHPDPWSVLDPAAADPADCYEIPLKGITVTNGLQQDGGVDIHDIRVGDFVQVRYSEKMDTATRPAKIYSVTLCQNVTKQMTVSQVSEGLNRILLGGTALSRGIFDEGHVLDTSGNTVAFADVCVGDLFEVQFGGEILASMPGQFSHLHVVRRIKTAEQGREIGEAAEQAVREALEVRMRPVLSRGTIGTLENGTMLVWLGETLDPAELGYIAAAHNSVSCAIITDAVTGQTLTWGDLRYGDYIAIKTNGIIDGAAPGQMAAVYDITRLYTASMEGMVSDIRDGTVTVTNAYGTARTVSVDGYCVHGVRLDPDSLRVGDKVRLDFNARDENEVYALHLLERASVMPEVLFTETYRVTHISGGLITVEGDIAFETTNQILFDVDGSPCSVHNIRTGDLLGITHNGRIEGGDPYMFSEIYRIERVAE